MQRCKSHVLFIEADSFITNTCICAYWLGEMQGDSASNSFFLIKFRLIGQGIFLNIRKQTSITETLGSVSNSKRNKQTKKFIN